MCADCTDPQEVGDEMQHPVNEFCAGVGGDATNEFAMVYLNLIHNDTEVAIHNFRRGFRILDPVDCVLCCNTLTQEG